MSNVLKGMASYSWMATFGVRDSGLFHFRRLSSRFYNPLFLFYLSFLLLKLQALLFEDLSLFD